MSQSPAPNPEHQSTDFSQPLEPRRNFFVQFLAVVIGGVVGLVPVIVGVATFLNPLRKTVKEKQRATGSDDQGFYKVVPLTALTQTPQALKIIADRKDAWNTFPKEAIGAIYLQRVGEKEVRAFNAVCPHAGCIVDYRPKSSQYQCPCHDSSFAEDGTRDPKSPSARDLDKLETRVVDGIVCVKFQNFKAGDKEMKPV
jgi:Rieske Fe-S protein